MYFQRVMFLFITGSSGILLSSLAQGSKIPEGTTEAHIFPEGHFYLFTSSTKQGLFFFNGRKNELLRIAPRTGTVSSFDGGRWPGFKWIQPGRKGLPVAYQTNTGQVIILPTTSAEVGVPSFSENGQIACCDENKIVLADSNRTQLRSIRISSYANLTPISPNGRWVASNNSEDQIWIVSTADPSNRQELTDGRHAYFNPRWNHTSGQLLIQSVDGRIFISGLQPHSLKESAEGTRPVWSPDVQSIACQKSTWSNCELISNGDIATIRSDSGQRILITNTRETLESPPQFISKNEISYVEDHARILTKSFGTSHSLQKSLVRFSFPDVRRAVDLTIPVPLQKAFSPESPGEMIDIPYVHQVYDTRDWLASGIYFLPLWAGNFLPGRGSVTEIGEDCHSECGEESYWEQTYQQRDSYDTLKQAQFYFHNL